jgi:hypothetical protein
MGPIRGKNPVMDFKHWLLRIQEIETFALKALDTPVIAGRKNL